MTTGALGGGTGDAGTSTANTGTNGGTGTGGAGGAAPGVADPKAAGLGTAASGGTASWRDTLPDDIKNDPTLSKYSDLTNLAKSHIEAQKLIGKKGVFKPSENATAEEWRAFRESIGVPSVDKYDIPQPKGFEFPKETMEWAKKTFGEIGVLPQDASALMSEYAEFEAARDKASSTAKAKAVKEQLGGLQKEWGDNYGAQLKRGDFALVQLAEMAGVSKDQAIELAKKDVGSDPVFIKIMAAASKLFKEDTLRENGVGGSVQTQDDIQNQMKDAHGQLLSMSKSDPRRPSALARYESLNKQATGGR